MEYTNLEDLKSSDVQYADERRSLAFSAVNGTVDSLDNPLKHALIDGLADRLHGKLHLHQSSVIAMSTVLCQGSKRHFYFFTGETKKLIITSCW